MRTEKLEGIMLDYWIAKAKEYTLEPYLSGYRMRDKEGDVVGFVGPLGVTTLCNYSPSTNWSQGGPILEDNAITVTPISDAEWMAEEHITLCNARGFSYLISGMRCYLVSKYGEELPELI